MKEFLKKRKDKSKAKESFYAFVWRIIKHAPVLFGFALCSLWVKNYIVFRFEFDLDVENVMQEFILVLTPLAPILIVLSWGWLMKPKKQKWFILISHVVLTLLLYSNLVFYRFFNDFITIPVLFQTKNVGDLGSSALGLMRPTDALYFVDYIILLVLFWKRREVTHMESSHIWKRLMFKTTLLGSLAAGSLNLILAEEQRPQLLTRTFDRQILVRLLGVYNFQLYDMVMYTKSATERAFASGDDVTEVENYIKNRSVQPNPSLFGVAKGKNVVIVSLESTQNFLLGYQLNGQEVTPFLNKLRQDSLYFDQFYHQTGQGKTSDAEFLVENSWFGLPRGSAFSTRSGNTYRGMAKIVGENGYMTSVFHGNNASFWNRDKMYPKLGIDKFFDETYFTINEGETVGYGLKDVPFFQQSVDIMKGLKQPFYARMITLTNHYPYTMDEKDIMNEPHQTGDVSVDRYFQTARYQDYALEQFFQHMKDKGLYENTIFVLYGDHYGISENHNKAMEQVIGKPITPIESVELQKVPFFIHIPGIQGQTIHTLGGQLDIKPTLLHLLGISTESEFVLGQDLFAQERSPYVVFRDGSVVGERYVYTKEKCYETVTRLRVEGGLCTPLETEAKELLRLSDKVLYGDLLRFRPSAKISEPQQ